MNASEENKVEIYHRVNKLKMKAGGDVYAGAGYIDPHAVKKAQTVIDSKQSLYKEEVVEVLNNMAMSWEKVKTSDGEDKEKALDALYNFANNIKDLASLYGYELMQHFGESLREFTEKIDVDKKAHHTIVQAHIDVMYVAYHENIKDHGGPKAEELKMIVAKAIEKYG